MFVYINAFNNDRTANGIVGVNQSSALTCVISKGRLIIIVSDNSSQIAVNHDYVRVFEV